MAPPRKSPARFVAQRARAALARTWRKPDRRPPPFPIDRAGGAIHLPAALVHELFHLVADGNVVEAIRQVRALTGASERQARAYVATLLARR
jgi:hypothetical protein